MCTSQPMSMAWGNVITSPQVLRLMHAPCVHKVREGKGREGEGKKLRAPRSQTNTISNVTHNSKSHTIRVKRERDRGKKGKKEEVT